MKRFKNILVVVPREKDPSGRTVTRAGELAARNSAALTILDVVPSLRPRARRVAIGNNTVDLEQLMIETRTRELSELIEALDIQATVRVEIGVPFATVIETVERDGHDLVITAPDGGRAHGLRGASTALHLLRKCPCPVWVDDPLAEDRPDVLAAVGPFSDDGQVGELNRTLMELATSLAEIKGGAVHVVHAWRLEGESLLRNGRAHLRPSDVDALVEQEKIAAELAFQWLIGEFSGVGPRIHPHLLPGAPTDAITEIAREARPGVVVMGTLARAGLPGLIIGNTAERLLAELDTSVMAVKPPGFVSPVTAAPARLGRVRSA